MIDNRSADYNLLSDTLYEEFQGLGELALQFHAYVLSEEHKILMETGDYRSALRVTEQIEAIDKLLLPLRNPADKKFSIHYDGPNNPYINTALNHIFARIETLRQVCAEESANGAKPHRIEELEAAMDTTWEFQFLLGVDAFTPS